VLVDDPCYFNFQYLMQAQRVRMMRVALYPEWARPRTFSPPPAAEHRPKLYLTTAVLHNPTGLSVSAVPRTGC